MSLSSKGFTLIELVAVLSIISIMLFMTLPRFNIFSQTDDIKGVSRWIIASVPRLKSKAVSEQKSYVLRADLDQNAFYIEVKEIEENMQNPDKKPDKNKDGDNQIPETRQYQLSDNVVIESVLYPKTGAVLSGRADINFYANGYCDRAIIHIADNENTLISFFLEPFLNRVAVFDGHLDFSQVQQVASGSN